MQQHKNSGGAITSWSHALDKTCAHIIPDFVLLMLALG